MKIHSDSCDKRRQQSPNQPCTCLAALPVRSPNVRNTDPSTSRAAASAIDGSLSKIQKLVLRVYQDRGSFSARQAEKFEEFSDYGFSTIRKRISELAASGHLTAIGTEVDSGRTPSTVYEITRA